MAQPPPKFQRRGGAWRMWFTRPHSDALYVGRVGLGNSIPDSSGTWLMVRHGDYSLETGQNRDALSNGVQGANSWSQ